MSDYMLAIKLDDLAVRLDKLFDDFDSYGYCDAFSERTDGIENFMTGLKEDPDGVIYWLNDVIKACEDDIDDPWWNKFYVRAEELLKEVNEWISKI